MEYDCISMQGLPALNRIQSNKSLILSTLRPRTVSTRIVIRVISQVWTSNTRLRMPRTCSPTVERLGLKEQREDLLWLKKQDTLVKYTQ